eukprot:gene27740-400_t
MARSTVGPDGVRRAVVHTMLATSAVCLMEALPSVLVERWEVGIVGQLVNAVALLSGVGIVGQLVNAVALLSGVGIVGQLVNAVALLS